MRRLSCPKCAGNVELRDAAEQHLITYLTAALGPWRNHWEARGTLAAILRDELRVIVREEFAAARQLEEPTAELEELRRMNAYLKGELERRDKETAKVEPPWWFWVRG